jgi:hypothetical protein
MMTLVDIFYVYRKDGVYVLESKMFFNGEQVPVLSKSK